MSANASPRVVTKTQVVKVVFLIFWHILTPKISGAVRGNRAMGPFTRNAKSILIPDNTPYNNDNNLLGFVRLTMQK
jgi:hypothetical protein